VIWHRTVHSLTLRVSDTNLLSAAALIAPTVGFVAPLGLAPLLGAVAIGLVVIRPRRIGTFPRILRPLAILVALMAFWGGLSTLWSIVPGHSILEAARLTLVTAMGLVVASAGLTLDAAGRVTTGRASLVGFVLAVAVVSIEAVGDFPLRRAMSNSVDPIAIAVLDRGSNVLTLICWLPILYLLQGRRVVAAGLIFVVTLLVVSQLMSLSANLSLVLAAGTFALAWRQPRATATLLIVGFVALTLIMPFSAPTGDTMLWLRQEAPSLRISAAHRLAIWRFTSDRIAEKPILGWGMDASRAMPGGNGRADVYMKLPPSFNLSGNVMPLHPHNAILQWWIELGIVGAILGAGSFGSIAWRAGTGVRQTSRGVALAAIATAIPPLLLSFGIWQAWWQSALWLVAALIIAIRHGTEPDFITRKVRSPGGDGPA
jgi:exopolysaccharide production protein ExoQ